MNALRSRFDPKEQAEKWVHFHDGILAERSKVFILGFGNGLHVDLALQFNPKISVKALELGSDVQVPYDRFSPDCVQILSLKRFDEDELDHILETILKDNYSVLIFRPCWADQQDQYMRIYAYLTCRSEEGFSAGKRILKTLHPTLNSEEAWFCLQQLVR